MHLYAAGQGHSSTKAQEVIDLQVNNEALLCMLERERQHSQRLAEALQQAEANALEVSPLHLRWVQIRTGSHGSTVCFVDTNAPWQFRQGGSIELHIFTWFYSCNAALRPDEQVF